MVDYSGQQCEVEGDRLAMMIGSGTNLSVVGVQIAEIPRAQ